MAKAPEPDQLDLLRTSVGNDYGQYLWRDTQGFCLAINDIRKSNGLADTALDLSWFLAHEHGSIQPRTDFTGLSLMKLRLLDRPRSQNLVQFILDVHHEAKFLSNAFACAQDMRTFETTRNPVSLAQAQTEAIRAIPCPLDVLHANNVSSRGDPSVPTAPLPVDADTEPDLEFLIRSEGASRRAENVLRLRSGVIAALTTSHAMTVKDLFVDVCKQLYKAECRLKRVVGDAGQGPSVLEASEIQHITDFNPEAKQGELQSLLAENFLPRSVKRARQH